MKKIIVFLTILALFAPAAYATPRGESEANDAAPLVLYGKTSTGSLVAIKTDASGNVQTVAA